MTLLPSSTLSWTNAFWFSLLPLVTSFSLVALAPEHFRKRVFTMPDFPSLWGNLAKRLNMLCFITMLILPFFTPLSFESVFFALGLTVFTIGYAFYMTALVNYAATSPDRPVVKGVYRFSRNPQQIGMIIMWIGVGLATETVLFFVLCGLQLILAYPTFLAQEQFCLERYGDEYLEYMKRTPRYLFFVRSN